MAKSEKTKDYNKNMESQGKYEFYDYHEAGERVRQTTIIRLLQVIKLKTKEFKPSQDGLVMTRFDFTGDRVGGMLINYIHESSPHHPFVLATIISYEQVSKEDDIAVFRDYAILGRDYGLDMEKFEHVINKSDDRWNKQVDPEHPDFNFITAAMKDLDESKIVEDGMGHNIVTDDEALELLEIIKKNKT